MSDENKSQIEERNLVFIGAQRAGKTCLMAAWYEFLSNFPNIDDLKVSEDGDFENSRIKNVWVKIKNDGVAPPPTELGMVRSNRVEFYYKSREYAFNFIDLSGETATQAFTGELDDAEIKQQIVETCKNADRLFLVISLEDYARQQQNQLADLLSFLDQVMKRPDFRVLFKHGLCIYLSHAEKLNEQDRTKYTDEIRARFKNALPKLKEDVCQVCTSVVEDESGKIRFAEEGDAFSPQRLLHHIFADLVAVDQNDWITKIVSKAEQTISTKRGIAILSGVIILTGLLIYGIDFWLNSQKEQDWQSHIEKLQAANPEEVTEANVSKKSTFVRHWKTKAKDQFPERYKRDEYDTKIGDYESLYDRIETSVKQPEDLKKALRQQVKAHENNYHRLYPAILNVAENALANPGRWSPAAIEEWSEIQRFIQALQKGVYLGIKKPSFVTDFSNDDFILEFHVFGKNAKETPFGKGKTTTGLRGISFPAADNIPKANGKYRFAWDQTKISNEPYRPKSDRIVVRFMEEEWWWSSWQSAHQEEIPQESIHGLGWFNDEREVLGKNKHSFRFNFRDFLLFEDPEGTKRVKIPEILEEVFR